MTVPAEATPPSTPPTRRLRAALPAAAVSVVAVLALVVLLQRHQQPAYVMPIAVLVIAGLCLGLTLAGAALATWRGEALLPWLTTLTTLLFLAAVVSMFSIGPLVLLVALLSLVVRLRLGSRRRPGARRSRIGAGLLLSVGLAPLSLLALDQPVVACRADGVSGGEPVWTWFSSGGGGFTGGGSSSSSDHTTTGSVSVGGRTYTYTCRGGELVTFASH